MASARLVAIASLTPPTVTDPAWDTMLLDTISSVVRSRTRFTGFMDVDGSLIQTSGIDQSGQLKHVSSCAPAAVAPGPVFGI